MRVEGFLELSARRYPEKIFLVHGDERMSFGEANERSTRIARGLRRMGVRRGDRVAVFLDNSIEAVLALFAVLKAGGVFLIAHPTTKREKLTFILNQSGATALVTHGRKLSAIRDDRSAVDPIDGPVVVALDRAAGGRVPESLAPFESIMTGTEGASDPLPDRGTELDLAALIYTSGSTGIPKGVMMTHSNIVYAASSISAYLENTQDDVIINVLPLSFDYGLYQILMAALTGATVVLERSFTYPHAVLDHVIRERVTGFPMVPTVAAILLQMDLGKYDLSSLRYITNTGASLPTHHIARLRRLLPRVRLYSMYGLTECKRVSYLNPDQIDHRPGSVGKPMAGMEAEIIDERGLPTRPGIVGELVVRGPNVMQGYWDMPEESRQILKAGPSPGDPFLYTGDLFYKDEEGYLFFVGRRDDMIKTRGDRVSPKEIENALQRLDGIAEAAVVGVPDAIQGQAVKAFILLENGTSLTEKDILSHCAQHLEDHMIPTFIEFRSNLPKTPTGKIDKRELTLSAGERP